MSSREIRNDSDWADLGSQWELREDTVYLNHGSFGPPPAAVRTARRHWIDQLERQPMDFFVRSYSEALRAARQVLSEFLGTRPENLVFVENSTAGMNVLADSFPLTTGDEVVLTDHEYGAVTKIWQRACRRAGTNPPKVATLPLPIESVDAIVDAVFAATSEQTRLIVVSHITSATAIILPVARICREARLRGIEVCIDGPHAPAQLELRIDDIQCNYYTASCHKWLCAPFGSGFLYVAPPNQPTIEPQQMSWGLIPPETPSRWDEEFLWSGTRDPSSYLGVSAAIEFLESVGLPSFRERTHYLARHARQLLQQLPDTAAITPDDPQWYGSMCLVRLSDGDALGLQRRLWQNHGIEVPIIEFAQRRYVRVSCHLYNHHQHIETLLQALHEEL